MNARPMRARGDDGINEEIPREAKHVQTRVKKIKQYKCTEYREQYLRCVFYVASHALMQFKLP